MSDFGADQWWEVVSVRGALVRNGVEASSAEVGTLAHGKRIRVAEAALSVGGGARLRICEPMIGWVSRKCVAAVDHKSAAKPSARWAIELASSGCARWAVNIHNCEAALGEALPEGHPVWTFLLSLIAEKAEREAVSAYLRLHDRIRALLSRLLVRRCCSVALGMAYVDVAIERTKGRKPFLSNASRRKCSDLSNKPNFNFNVSHEGAYVVLASEPCCVCGVDVAAPEQFRRSNRPTDNTNDFFHTMRDTLTTLEWSFVHAAADPSVQAERFRYFWSCKEAFTKARGDGIAFGVGRAEFELEMLTGPRLRFQATVAVDGLKLEQWRFFGEELADGHIVTVARGPPADIVDAKGSFKKSFRRQRLADHDFHAADPNFVLLTMKDLVPNDRLAEYDAALDQQGAPVEE